MKIKRWPLLVDHVEVEQISLRDRLNADMNDPFDSLSEDDWANLLQHTLDCIEAKRWGSPRPLMPKGLFHKLNPPS